MGKAEGSIFVTMQRRASVSGANLPTGKKSTSSKADIDNVQPPFGDAYRSPCPHSGVMTSRKVSKTLGKGGLLYGSQESVCSSYLRGSGTNSIAMKPGRGLREPSLPRSSGIDPSLMYSHPEPAEDRSVDVGIGWRGTGGRGSRQSSRTNLADTTFRFLPAESVNQEKPPQLIIKKSPMGGSRQGLNHMDSSEDSGVEADGEGGEKRKKLSNGSSTADITKREMELDELFHKFETIQEVMAKVQTIGEQILQRQVESEDFQKQMKKETEGYDLQRGVYRILEALDGDRRELERLKKKATEMGKRQNKGAFFDGENEELRSLVLGANDLEKKLLKGLEELGRLRIKTEELIERQRAIDEQRRLKLEEEAKKNEALLLLLKDSEHLDQLLKDLSEVKSDHIKAESLHRKIQILSKQFEDSDEMDTDEIILQRIGVDTQSATDNILRIRDEIQGLQDALIGEDEVDVISEASILREKIDSSKIDVAQLKADIKEFQDNQIKRYDMLMRKKSEYDEERKRKELEEERRKMEEMEKLRKQEDERRLRELAEQELENERKKREAELKAREDKLKDEAEQNRLKQVCAMIDSIDGDSLEILRMKDQVLILIDKQKKIGHIREKRRELYTIPEDEEARDEAELNGLIDRTKDLMDYLISEESHLSQMKNDIDNKSIDDVMKDVLEVENGLTMQSHRLKDISKETDDVYNKHQSLLDEGLKNLSEGEAKKQAILNKIFDEKQMFDKIKKNLNEIEHKHQEIGTIIQEKKSMEDKTGADYDNMDADLQLLIEERCHLLTSVLKDESDINEVEAQLKSGDIVEGADKLAEMELIIPKYSSAVIKLREQTDKLFETQKRILDETKERNKKRDILAVMISHRNDLTSFKSKLDKLTS